ncbi:phosphatase PAP2 family protein [Halalkalibacter alkaliphilus]|uniref:Phosphatase PAP2 family protein n=1 Tax=Halalkalibacter alkaliphilus TaxID=2917993 RepID=A0A9X2CP12_9BACI|nr:phosphatase PAP2 family protein [Halalkalibacter alkaliphilus]MCL7745647.1 phosphatase PAP2 family protein [Halalkalibacter alkaliphilus]
MNVKLFLKLLFLGVVPLISFIVLTYFVMTEKTLRIDVKVITYVRTLEHPIVTKGMKALSFVGNTWPVIIISILLLLLIYKLYRKRDEVILFIIVSLGSTGMNQLFKYSFKRERPLFEQLVMESGYSYPSGHSMAAFTLYGIVTFLFWRHIKSALGRTLLVTFCTVMILAIGTSRVYLGVHFPSDVVGAYLLSGFWLFLTIWVYQYIKERQPIEK